MKYRLGENEPHRHPNVALSFVIQLYIRKTLMMLHAQVPPNYMVRRWDIIITVRNYHQVPGV